MSVETATVREDANVKAPPEDSVAVVEVRDDDNHEEYLASRIKELLTSRRQNKEELSRYLFEMKEELARKGRGGKWAGFLRRMSFSRTTADRWIEDYELATGRKENRSERCDLSEAEAEAEDENEQDGSDENEDGESEDDDGSEDEDPLPFQKGAPQDDQQAAKIERMKEDERKKVAAAKDESNKGKNSTLMLYVHRLSPEEREDFKAWQKKNKQTCDALFHEAVTCVLDNGIGAHKAVMALMDLRPAAPPPVIQVEETEVPLVQ